MGDVVPCLRVLLSTSLNELGVDAPSQGKAGAVERTRTKLLPVLRGVGQKHCRVGATRMSFNGSWSLGVSGTVGNLLQPMQTFLSLVLSSEIHRCGSDRWPFIHQWSSGGSCCRVGLLWHPQSLPLRVASCWCQLCMEEVFCLRETKWQRFCRIQEIFRFHSRLFLVGRDWSMTAWDLEGSWMVEGNRRQSLVRQGGRHEIRIGETSKHRFIRYSQRDGPAGKPSKSHVPNAARLDARPGALRILTLKIHHSL